MNKLWITKNGKNLIEAENCKGKIVATGATLELLETSLNLIYQCNWVGYVGMITL